MKKKAIKIAASTAVAASAFVAAAPANKADAAVNVDQLVKDAENAAGALKWAISVEGTADGQTAPHALYNLTKDANKAAQAAVAKTKGTDKVLYTARLQAVELQISRAMAYIDGITAGKKIAADTATLNAAIAAKDLTKVEAAYHQMTKEYRKQAALLDRVYGQSTRDVIRNATKKPAEAAIEAVKIDVTVKMHLDAAAAATKAGDYKKAGESYAKAMDWFNKISATFKTELTKSKDDVLAALPLTPVSVTVLNDTSLSIKFNKEVDVVSISHFAFDNGLSVTDAKLDSDKKTVTLSTTKQAAGKTYKLFYKGNATAVSFSTAANPTDNSLVIDENSEVYLKSSETRSFTVTFKNADGQPYRGYVDITTIDNVTVAAVNGVNGAPLTNVVPNADGKITITVRGSVAGASSTYTGTGQVKFTNKVTGKEQTTAKTHFVASAANGDRYTTNTTIDYVNKDKKFFVANSTWHSYDANDKFFNNGSAIDQAAFENLLAAGNQLGINYQNETTANGISYFNVTYVKTLKDLKFAAKLQDTTAANPLRVAPEEQFSLSGEAHPGYNIHIYYGAGKTYLGTTTVNSSGQWSYPLNLIKSGLEQFTVVQQAATESRNDSLKNSSNKEIADTAYVLEGAFNVAGVTSTFNTSGDAVSIGSEVTLTFSTVGGVQDKATFASNASLTFVDNQGVEATYTIGVDGTERTTANNSNTVTVKLGKPVYKWPQGNTNIAFNHKATITLTGATGITNQSGLDLKLPPFVTVR